MTAVRVDVIDEGGYLVRGTPDLTEDEARAAIIEHLVAFGDDYDGQGPWDASDAAATVGRLDCRIGLYRKQPCICGGGHGWDMMPADRRGKGVFTGAHLDR